MILVNAGSYCYINACVRSWLWMQTLVQEDASMDGAMFVLFKLLLKATQSGTASNLRKLLPAQVLFGGFSSPEIQHDASE